MDEKEIPSMIKGILTLRYNPSLKSNWKKFMPNDFTLHENSEYISYIEKTIVESIKNGIKPDEKRVAVALSGGIDSTLVLGLLRKTFPQINIDAISVKFADSIDETTIATNTAKHFDAEHHIVSIENFLEELPKAIGIFKMPFWDTHWYHVVKTAKKFSNTLVSGDGGDELFGGYTFRYEKFLSKFDSSMTSKDKAHLYLECHERDWVSDQKDLFGSKVDFSWDEIYKILMPYFENQLSPIDQIFLADLNGKLLFNWIPMNTSFFDYFGVQSLTPLLSEKLVLFATHLDNKIKYNQKSNSGKIPLRQILNRHVDTRLITPKKQGFSVNTVNLWKSHGKKLCEYYLDEARIVKDGWINKEWVNTHYKKLNEKTDIRYVNKFLGLLAFEIWYRMFITKEIDENTILST